MSIRSLGTLTLAAVGLLGVSCASSSPGNGGSGGKYGTGGVVGSAGTTGGGSGGSSSQGTGGSGTGGDRATGTGGGSATGGGGGSGTGGSGTGGSVRPGSGGATGTGGIGVGPTTMGTPAPSMGCGKTATLTFGTVPGEMANATPGSPNLGTGKGGWVTIASGGQSRNFALRLPDNYDNNHPYRLIFAFHGNGESAAGMDSGGANGYFTAYWGLQRESKNGAIFVAPEWNGGGWTQSDIAFTDDMVKTISTNYCVDMSDIITSGFSFGGGMSHALACSRANPRTNTAGYAFRAAVLFEACSFLVNGSCPNHDPIAIWQKAGITDGTCGFDDSKIVRNWFTDRDGCTGWKSETGNVAASTTGPVSQEPPQPPTPGRFMNPGGHICTNYTGCSAGAVRWCADQAGHGNATADGTSSLFDECANVTSQFPHGNCSPGCPCTWTPDDVWTWLNDPTINKYTPNITSN